MSHGNLDDTDDKYLTLAREMKAGTTVRGSRFKAFIKPVDTVKEAEHYLKSLKELYQNATHHCYAFIINGDSGQTIRSSDAGEPAGTAGKPILATLQGHTLSNVICVVVRYFGGTKLGVGGLARAYAEAAKSVLLPGEIVERFIIVRVRFTFPYEMTGAVEKLTGKHKVVVTGRAFGETSTLDCTVRKNMIQTFIKQFMNATRGKGNAIILQ